MDKQTEPPNEHLTKALDILQQANCPPDNISKEGCLALARAGKAVWNAWREAYPVSDIQGRATNNANFDSCNFIREPIDFSIREPIDFSGFVFGALANFNGAQFGFSAEFEGAQFGNGANFKGAQFAGWADFEEAQFAGWADFEEAQFGNYANFNSAQFGNYANFNSAQFGNYANFNSAQFGHANFNSAQFGNMANFNSAQFDDRANFNSAQFDDRANFNSAQFGGSAEFEGAQFGNGANFKGAQFGDWAGFEGAQFDGRVNFSGVDWALTSYGNQTDERKTWAELRSMTPNRFKGISFQGVTFKGAVDFSNREFTDTVDFSALKKDVSSDDKVVILPAGTLTTFAVAPRFHNATLHPDTSFDGAQFLDVGEPDRDRASIERAAHAYRTLKLAFSEQQATRQEQQFLRLEMAEEALLAPSVREWLRGQREYDLPPRFYYTIYRLLSDYGFSIWRPVVLLLASLSVLFLPWLALGWGAWFLWCVMGTPTKKERGKSLLSLLSLVGLLVGILIAPTLLLGLWQAVSHCDLCGDYMNVAIPALFPSPFSSHNFDWCCIEETSAALQTVQKVLAVLAWFLIGLALRNRFKMK